VERIEGQQLVEGARGDGVFALGGVPFGPNLHQLFHVALLFLQCLIAADRAVTRNDPLGLEISDFGEALEPDLEVALSHIWVVLIEQYIARHEYTPPGHENPQVIGQVARQRKEPNLQTAQVKG